MVKFSVSFRISVRTCQYFVFRDRVRVKFGVSVRIRVRFRAPKYFSFCVRVRLFKNLELVLHEF